MKRRAMLAALAVPACGLASGAGAAHAVPPLAQQVRSRLSDARVLRGQFEQRRTLKGFRNPIVSRGDYVVARDRGVAWRTREPFASVFVLTRERMLARGADGRIGTDLDARAEPALRLVNRMLYAVMVADLAALEEGFRIDGSAAAAAWQLVLVPRDMPLALWVSRIELEGDRHVEGVRLFEPRGDASVIRLSRQSAAEALTPEEEARFG
jgi:hypothetical protein